MGFEPPKVQPLEGGLKTKMTESMTESRLVLGHATGYDALL
jgi:hypothetical protein